MTRQKAVGLLLGLCSGWAAFSTNAQFSYPYYWIPRQVGYGHCWSQPYYGYPRSCMEPRGAASPQPGAPSKDSAASQAPTVYQAPTPYQVPPAGSWAPTWGETYYPCPHFSARSQGCKDQHRQVAKEVAGAHE